MHEARTYVGTAVAVNFAVCWPRYGGCLFERLLRLESSWSAWHYAWSNNFQGYVLRTPTLCQAATHKTDYSSIIHHSTCCRLPWKSHARRQTSSSTNTVLITFVVDKGGTLYECGPAPTAILYADVFFPEQSA